MTTASESNSEWLTRKRRIDPRLDSLGWRMPTHTLGDSYRLEEFPTDNGPADYALCSNNQVLSVIEAKKLSLGPQNVLTQAERLLDGSPPTPSTSPASTCHFSIPPMAKSSGSTTSATRLTARARSHRSTRQPRSRKC